jgi:hypothetical protein
MLIGISILIFYYGIGNIFGYYKQIEINPLIILFTSLIIILKVGQLKLYGIGKVKIL